ncbi:MAG: diguanylate cyclase, partial [Heliobacteriaceae bacterium]|nr:diguanylate cyclase [Heliobacteriaceae bacterium]
MSQSRKNPEYLLRAVAAAANCLIAGDNFPVAVNEALAILGRAVGADRVWVFEFHQPAGTGEPVISHRYEWARERIKPLGDNPGLQAISRKNPGFQRWYECLVTRSTLSGPVKDFPAEEQAFLRLLGVVSVLNCPIFVREKLWGVIGFDDCATERRWAANEESILTLAAVSIGGAIMRQQKDIALGQAKENLENVVRERTSTLQAVLNALPDLLVRVDQEGTILECRAGREMELIYPPAELPGKSIFDTLPGDVARLVAEHLERALKGEPAQVFEYSLNVKDRLRYEETRMVAYGEKEVLVIVRDITERKQAEERLRFLCLHDCLTQVSNRTYFEAEMRRLESGRFNPVGLIVCDVDGLKLVNDTFGHNAGDKLLVAAAQVLKSCFRESDLVCRIGGDEFAVLLPHCSQPVLERITGRIRRAIDTYNQVEPGRFLSMSLGYAVRNDGSVRMRDLFREADNNLYREKLNQSEITRGAFIAVLKKALDARDFISEGHARRLKEMARALAQALDLSERCLNDLCLLAWYHDIGKVGVANEILFKPGPLTPGEKQEV